MREIAGWQSLGGCTVISDCEQFNWYMEGVERIYKQISSLNQLGMQWLNMKHKKFCLIYSWIKVIYDI